MPTSNQNNPTQLTFQFVDGRSESYNVLLQGDSSVAQIELIRHIFDKPSFILQLPEQTVCIKTANIVKVEVKPALPEIQGDDVFSDARRVTALTRTVLR